MLLGIRVWLVSCTDLRACLGRLVLALSLVAPGWAAAVDEAAVEVDYRDGRYFAHLHLEVAVPPARAREVLTDFDRMAGFMPNLESSRLVSHAGNVFVVHQRGVARFGPFFSRFESERRIEWFADGRLVSHSVPGSTNVSHSELRLRATATGSDIDYRVEVVPGLWLPVSLATAFLRHELAEQFSAMSAEMLRREQKARGVE